MQLVAMTAQRQKRFFAPAHAGEMEMSVTRGASGSSRQQRPRCRFQPNLVKLLNGRRALLRTVTRLRLARPLQPDCLVPEDRGDLDAAVEDNPEGPDKIGSLQERCRHPLVRLSLDIVCNGNEADDRIESGSAPWDSDLIPKITHGRYRAQQQFPNLPRCQPFDFVRSPYKFRDE
ncbi:hypothetical protein ACU8MW_08485 [Rhizobium leguminosarum]